MFRFMKRFGSDSHASWRGTGSMTRVRRHNHPLNCEALEGRQLLSAAVFHRQRGQRQGARRPGGLDQQRDRDHPVPVKRRGQPEVEPSKRITRTPTVRQLT